MEEPPKQGLGNFFVKINFRVTGEEKLSAAV